MKLTFRRLMIGSVLAIVSLSVGALAYFFLELYRSDKISTLFETETQSVQRMASHIESLVKLSYLIDPERVENSREIAFVLDDPCNRAQEMQVQVSRFFKKHFDDVEMSPTDWADSLDVFRACEAIQAAKGDSGKTAMIEGARGTVVPSQTPLMVPYLLLLLKTARSNRLALVSLDGFQGGSAHTIFLTDQKGKIFWTADGLNYVEGAIRDTELQHEELAEAAAEATESGRSKTHWAGKAGLLSYAPAGNGWVIMSLGYAPDVLSSVTFASRQLALLAFGVFFLSLFFGKRIAEALNRPFGQLQSRVEKIGNGDFSPAADFSRFQEFSQANTAFNVMSQKIEELVENTRSAAELKKDLLLAEQVQKMLIPPPRVVAAHHRIVSYMKSAVFVGGDWWGYLEIPRPDSTPLLLIMIGDATGHGVPPALVAATIEGARSMLGHWMKENTEVALDLRQVLSYLNQLIHQAAKGSVTMTFFAAILDINRKELICSNAGHNFPYLLSRSGVRAVGSPGPALGEAKDAVFTELDTYPWEPGSRLFLYSDGLIDTFDPKTEDTLFGKNHLQRMMKQSLANSGEQLMAKVMTQRNQAIGALPPADDVTIVVCEPEELASHV